ncbi:MAG: class I SAM-dependent methyltransferase [Microthrixaceae bacterium]|jgi:SAM-dependent methyltransferase|nr:class I SAM-dependent methyltransferase [Microthrixaceae bacterium]
MSQKTTGIHRILSAPWIYQTYQRAIGSHRLWQDVIARLEIPSGGRMLDIGCGPGDVVRYLNGVDYVGFDLSEHYVAQAQDRYGRGGAKFFCADVTTVSPDELGVFDAVLSHGVLHHVDDDTARSIFHIASRVLRPGGKFVTVDGGYVEGQSRMARFLLDHDRGQDVRTPDAYAALGSASFEVIEVDVDHKTLRIPYTMVILRASEPRPVAHP